MVTIIPTGADDVQSIQSVQTANPGQTIYFQSGEYIVGSNLALVNHMNFEAGVVFRVGAGVTLSITGRFQASQTKHFDTSATGSKVILGSVTGESQMMPEYWGAVPDTINDSIMSANVKAVNDCFNYATDGHSVMFNTEFMVNDELRFNGGTRIESNKGRGLGGLRWKLYKTEACNLSLIKPIDTAQKCSIVGLRLAVDSTSTIAAGSRVKVADIAGGRWNNTEKNQIDFLAEFPGVYKIGLEMSGTTNKPAFNNRIYENVINGCNTDLYLSGNSGVPDSMGLVIGCVVKENQLLSAANVDWDMNLRMDACAGVTVVENIFNVHGQTGLPTDPHGGLNILTDDTCSSIQVAHNYWDAGKTGLRRVWIGPRTVDMRMDEVAISPAEIYKQSGATGIVFNGSAI